MNMKIELNDKGNFSLNKFYLIYGASIGITDVESVSKKLAAKKK